jgi:hypothetical protein
MTMLTMKNVFHLPNRVIEGFVRSVFAMLKVSLSVPDHSTLSRRGKGLKVALPKMVSGHLNIVIDSTGLKIYGEGEWKVRTHGKSKQRIWRKLHIGADPESGEIEAVALTENSVSDADMLESLLNQIDQPIDHFAGNGSYDKRKVYNNLNQYAPQAEVLIPPGLGELGKIHVYPWGDREPHWRLMLDSPCPELYNHRNDLSGRSRQPEL